MKLEKIVLYADTSESFSVRAAIASRLAKHDESELVVVYGVRRRAFWQAEFSTAGHLWDNYRQLYWDDEIKSRKILDEEARKAGFSNYRWVRNDHDTVAAICEEARFADVVILGARDGKGQSIGNVPDPAEVLVACDRPCLIVPQGTDSDWYPKKIAIAWNNSGECIRAVRENSKWLEASDEVHILSVMDNPPEHEALEIFLRNRGVSSSPLQFEPTESQSDADVILEMCKTGKFDLLIQGAFGHQRSYQLVFGGVTETMLSDAPVPVLMTY